MKLLAAILILVASLQFASCRRYTKPSKAITAERKKMEKKSIKSARKEIRKRRRNQRRSGYYGG